MSLINRSRDIDRRSFLTFTAMAAVSTITLPQAICAETEYSLYKGPISLGFSFSYPSDWAVKKKPIKTHLSEVLVTSTADSSTTAGIVVDAVKIDTIDKFGTAEVVGEKVVEVENKKDSVNSAKVLSAASMKKGGLLYYTIDYVVDSSRGVKRYIAKVTVTGKQLYVFTAQANVDGFQGEVESTISKMVDSFSVVPQYL